MNKLIVLASAVVCSTVAFAGDHADVSADVDGYYDVTLTTKRLAHSEKTVTKTFTTSRTKGSALDQFKAEFNKVSQYAGFEVIEVNGKIAFNLEELDVKTIKFKYSYFDFDSKGKYKTKVVSDSSKGVYDSDTGMVYLWNAASSAKVSVTNGTPGAIVASKKDNKGVEKQQSGYVAYQVPLAMHKQFVATEDNKAAGGFTGGSAKATDGTELNFAGFTAFGTGTLATSGDYKGSLKSVSGNVAMKDPTDIKYGAYGTWKLQMDTSSKNKGKDINTVLRNKGCVELFMEQAEVK